MTTNRILIGYKNNDEDQTDRLADIIDALDIEPIDSLISTPGNPVPEDIDFYSLIDILRDIIDRLP